MERTYTVHRILEDTPCITITGKWLRTLGIELGNKIRLVQDGEQLILMKIPDKVWKQEQIEKEIQNLEQETERLKKQLKKES